MDAIEQLGSLYKGGAPFPPKKGKDKDDAKGGDCATADKDGDGVPNSLDENPDDPKGADESAAEETAGAEGEEGEFPPEGEEGEFPPGEEGEFPPGEEAGGMDPQTVDLVEQLAAAEKDFYAAKGMHGPDHHKAEMAMEVFHKLVRKLAKQVHPNVGKAAPPMEEEANGAPPNGAPPFGAEQEGDTGGGGGAFGEQGGAPKKYTGKGDDAGEEQGGDEGGGEEGPPEEVIKEAKKAGMSDAAIEALCKGWMDARMELLEPTVGDEMKGKMEPDIANYSGDPNGGQFINWSGLVGHMNEAGKDGAPSGVHSGSGAGEAHPHYGKDPGFGKKPPGPPFGKMKPGWATQQPGPGHARPGQSKTVKRGHHGKQGEAGEDWMPGLRPGRGPTSQKPHAAMSGQKPPGPPFGKMGEQKPKLPMSGKLSDNPTGVEYAALGAAMRGPGAKRVSPSREYPLTGKAKRLYPRTTSGGSKRVMGGGSHSPTATSHHREVSRAGTGRRPVRGTHTPDVITAESTRVSGKMHGKVVTPTDVKGRMSAAMEYVELGAKMRGKWKRDADQPPAARRRPLPERAFEAARRSVVGPREGAKREGRRAPDRTYHPPPKRERAAQTQSGVLRGKMVVEQAHGLDYAHLGAKMRTDKPATRPGETKPMAGKQSDAGRGYPGPKRPTTQRRGVQLVPGKPMHGNMQVTSPKRVSRSREYPLTGKASHTPEQYRGVHRDPPTWTPPPGREAGPKRVHGGGVGKMSAKQIDTHGGAARRTATRWLTTDSMRMPGNKHSPRRSPKKETVSSPSRNPRRWRTPAAMSGKYGSTPIGGPSIHKEASPSRVAAGSGAQRRRGRHDVVERAISHLPGNARQRGSRNPNVPAGGKKRAAVGRRGVGVRRQTISRSPGRHSGVSGMRGRMSDDAGGHEYAALGAAMRRG
jgi:hypothetical protein